MSLLIVSPGSQALGSQATFYGNHKFTVLFWPIYSSKGLIYTRIKITLILWFHR